jgi:hypothetical protein
MVEKMLNIVQCSDRERSFMLQVDWKELLQISGMLTPQLMTPLAPSHGRSSETDSGNRTYPKVR